MVYCFSLGRLSGYQHYEFLCVEKFFHLSKTKKNKAFAEKGVRELVSENDADFYLAISLSKLPPKHYASPWLCCCSDSKLIRTQQLKVFFYNCSASPSQGATGQNSGPSPSSLSNHSYVHNSSAISLKFPFYVTLWRA